ncbi:hypothetical protein KDN24_06510 [Bacillus sp. Bva_UNVM-123]|uniref:DUF7446 family protein n=1 Tax=Bacillus sp. Bva_UNVM-123 TaxID=2829798 RepID=UPI00391FA726
MTNHAKLLSNAFKALDERSQNKLELSCAAHNGKVFAGKAKKGMSNDDGHKVTDITESFLRCVARYCTEEVEFEVDGMKFRATCERIE